MNHDNLNEILADAARALLAGQCTPATVRAMEKGLNAAPETDSLWRQLEEAGLPGALLSEKQGGSGLSLPDVFGVLEQCGAHALPLPLADTMVARYLLANAGMHAPDRRIVLASGTVGADGSVRSALVRNARMAHAVVLQTRDAWALLDLSDAQLTPQALAWDAGVHWSAAQWQAAPLLALPADVQVRTWQAAVVAAQMAGALQAVFDRSLQYANERQQFGRPIGKFQAIQHQLAVMSEHVFAARMAAQLGCGTPCPERLRVATAKARCSQAALAVAETAHAIHGAIGFTEEYDLQLFTRRLHAWRQTAGSEGWWHQVAGAALLEHEGLTLDLIRGITDGVSGTDAGAVDN